MSPVGVSSFAGKHGIHFSPPLRFIVLDTVQDGAPFADQGSDRQRSPDFRIGGTERLRRLGVVIDAVITGHLGGNGERHQLFRLSIQHCIAVEKDRLIVRPG